MLFWLIHFVTLFLAVAHHKRHHNLEHEIAKVVDRELRENIPLKALFVNANIEGAPLAGELFDLSAIDKQEDSSDLWNTRTSDQVHAKTLRLRVHAQGNAPNGFTSTWKDGTSLLRFLVFAWLPYATSTSVSAAAPGNVLDLRDPSTAGVEYLAPHLSQGQAGQFKVFLDETIPLSVAGGGITYVTTGPSTGIQYQVTYFFLREKWIRFH